ncbi:MAG: HU family DNA-binding protein [Pseudomonadota bacterium]
MNKAELITHVADETGLSKANSERAVNSVFQGIAKALGTGGKASFVGFGTFSVIDRASRSGRNPRTGETIQIPASRQPKFKAGKELREAVN